MKLTHIILSTFLAAGTCFAQAKKADLKEVTSHLDMDGAYFMANNMEGDLAKIAKLGTDYMRNKLAGKDKMPERAKNVDFVKLLNDTGLGDLLAYGRSAKHMGDHWTSKMYLQTGGSNRGVMSLLGEKASPYAVTQFAPKGTGLALELHLDLRQVDDLAKMIGSAMGGKCEEKINKRLSFEVTEGNTVENILNTLNVKASIAVKLDDKKRVVCPVHKQYNFPATHICARLEGGNKIWEQLKGMAGFFFKKETQADGTLLLTPLRKHDKWKDKEPVLLIDTKNNLIWATTHKAFLDECLSDGEKLSADAEFNTISGNLKTGNALAYISRQACLELRQVKEAKYKSREYNKFSPEYFKLMLDHVTESKNGYFASIVKVANGTEFTLKAPCPIKDMMGGKRGKKGCCKRGCKKGCDKGRCGCTKGGDCKCEKGKCECNKGDCGCSKGGECKCEKGKCECSKDKSVTTTKAGGCPLGYGK